VTTGPYGNDPWHQAGGQVPPPPPYAYGYAGVPGAPYGVHPVTGVPYSDKTKVAAGLLQLLLPFVGICGVGRLYAGHMAIGLIQLIGIFIGYVLLFVLIGFLVVPAIWLWTVIDGIVMLAGEPTDGFGRPLRP
jgi:TM2 domain-containing membrane protein YozV